MILRVVVRITAVAFYIIRKIRHNLSRSWPSRQGEKGAVTGVKTLKKGRVRRPRPFLVGPLGQLI